MTYQGIKLNQTAESHGLSEALEDCPMLGERAGVRPVDGRAGVLAHGRDVARGLDGVGVVLSAETVKKMTTNQLIGRLYDEIIERQGRVDNLSSFLRVSCMRYLSYVAEQQEKDHLMLKQPASADNDEACDIPEGAPDEGAAPADLAARPAASLHRLEGKRTRQA